MDSESAIVGMALYENAIVDEIKEQLPSPSYLMNEKNRTILRTVYDLHENDKDVAPVTVAEELEGEQLKDIGGASALADMAESYSVMDREAMETAIDNVIECHITREARKELHEANEDLKSDKDSVPTIQRLITSLESLQSEKTSIDISHVSEATDELYTMLEEAQEKGALPGTLSTGFSELDDRMKGISKTDFILISADTGIGKTSLALQIADTVTDAQNKNALIFSGEMHGWEIIMKLLSKRGVATLDEMQDGDIEDQQWGRMVNVISQLNDSGLYTIRESQPTIYDFKSAVRKANNEHGIDLAVLDYIQMLSNPDPESLDSVEHLNMVSTELRDFTNDIEVPVLAISRENKGGEIYGSSQLKYDCNYRIVIKDPNPENYENQKRLIKVEKARLARGGKIKMVFEGENSRFVRPDNNGRRSNDGGNRRDF